MNIKIRQGHQNPEKREPAFAKMNAGNLPGDRVLERFRAKWIPVRVKKTRQNKNLDLRF
jgi:hypothetical protein